VKNTRARVAHGEKGWRLLVVKHLQLKRLRTGCGQRADGDDRLHVARGEGGNTTSLSLPHPARVMATPIKAALNIRRLVILVAPKSTAGI
jgi:hypothetical protein